jgi:hypothetical protein
MTKINKKLIFSVLAVLGAEFRNQKIVNEELVSKGERLREGD